MHSLKKRTPKPPNNWSEYLTQAAQCPSLNSWAFSTLFPWSWVLRMNLPRQYCLLHFSEATFVGMKCLVVFYCDILDYWVWDKHLSCSQIPCFLLEKENWCFVRQKSQRKDLSLDTDQSESEHEFTCCEDVCGVYLDCALFVFRRFGFREYWCRWL